MRTRTRNNQDPVGRSLDSRGQSALYDAIIFFLLIIIASGVALFFASMAASDVDTGKKGFNTAFTEDFADCLLKSTVNYTYYEKNSGGRKNLTDRFVNELIVEDINARHNNLAPVASMAVINESIKQIGDGMALPNFRWGMSYSYSDGTKTTTVIVMSTLVQKISDTRYGSQITIKNTSPLSGNIDVGVYVWES